MFKNRTFFLLAANLLLALFIIIQFEDDPENGINMNAQFSEMIAKMQEIEFLHPSNEQKIVLRKDQIDWHITDPIFWTAEPISIANLISKISHLDPIFICSLDEIQSRGEIPQDYGFDENSSSFRLSSNHSELKITIGDLTRDQIGRYLLIDNQKSRTIWRGPHQIEQLANRPINEWAKLTFFDLPLYTIDAIEVHEVKNDENHVSTSLVKQNGNWFFSLPSNIEANGNAVSSLLHKLVSEKIIGFAEPESDEDSTKILEIVVRAMGQNYTLSFYQTALTETPSLLVKTSINRQSFYLQREFLENFINLGVKLREKRLFSLELKKVNRIKIIDLNHSLTLRRDERNNWIGLEDNGTNILTFRSDPQVVKSFVNNLNTIEVTSFIHSNPNQLTLSNQGLNSPQLQLEVEQEDSTRCTILISKSNSETSLWNTYLAEHALICLVDAKWDKLLSVKAIDYKDRRLLPTQFVADQIVLKSLDEGKVLSSFTYESKGESFERLLGFKADYFVDLSFNEEGVWVDGDWLPWMYSIHFENSEGSGANSLKFNLTDRIGGTKWYAGTEELGLVCNLPVFVIDELAKELKTKNTRVESPASE